MSLDYIKELLSTLLLIVKSLFSKTDINADEVQDAIVYFIGSIIVSGLALLGLKTIFWILYKHVFMIIADAYAMEILLGKFDLLFGIKNNIGRVVMIIVWVNVNKYVFRAFKVGYVYIKQIVIGIRKTLYFNISKLGAVTDEYGFDTNKTTEYGLYRVRFAIFNFRKELYFGAEKKIKVTPKIDYSKVVLEIEEPQEEEVISLLACTIEDVDAEEIVGEE